MINKNKSVKEDIVPAVVVLVLCFVVLFAMTKLSLIGVSVLQKAADWVNPVVNTTIIQKSWKEETPQHVETIGNRNYIVEKTDASYILTLEETKKYYGKEVYDVNVSKEVFEKFSENDQIDKTQLK